MRLSHQGGFEHVGERGGIDLDEWYHRHLPLISVHRSSGSGEDEAEPKKSSRDEVVERDLNEAIEGGDGPVRPIKAQPEHAPDHESNPYYDDNSQYAVSEIWLTALVDSLLRLYLPPEEYNVVVERIMVREILARSVLGGIAKRLCASWFWYSLLLKFIPLRTTTRSGSVHTAPTSKGASDGVKHGPVGQVVEAIWRTYLSILSLSIMIWMTLLKLWSTATWTMATLSSAPKVRHRYTSQWISLGRAVLGIDGNVALERKWLTRITWGVLEVVLELFSPMLDR